MHSPERRALDRVVRAYLVWCFRRQTSPRVSELAEMVGMSRTAFSRYFKRICGEPPSVVLKRAQLREAERLLQAGHSVNAAGYGAGVGTRRTIYRMFHRLRGMPPSAAMKQTK